MKEISSESKFVWKQILFIITLPFLLIQIIIGKKPLSALLTPFRDFFIFVTEARVTFFLILVNVTLFVAEFFMDKTLLESLAFRPEHLFQLQILPIIASWFLHANLLHLAGNMLFLFIFGRVVEMRFGAIKFLFIYFGSAIISSIISALFGQGGIGASGAIAGLIAAAILIQPFYLTYLFVGIPIPIMIVGWLAILADISGILIPKNDNIGHFAHLGGYLAITLLVFFFNKQERQQMKKGLIFNILFVIIALTASYYFGIL